MKHFTETPLVEKILTPCLVKPWEEKISKIRTQNDFLRVHGEFMEYRILEPALGEGIFLLEAYKRIKEIESKLFNFYQILFEIDVWRCQRELGFFPLRNLLGFEIDPESLQKAKENILVLQREIIEGEKTLEKPGSLDDLENLHQSDALFTPWPNADIVVGNPPFLGAWKIRSVLGTDYVRKLKKAFGSYYNGKADYCCYWYVKTIRECRKGIPVGFLTTNTLTQNNSREASLDLIFETGGQIFDAWDSLKWPGDVAVHVILVCFINKAFYGGIKHIDGKRVSTICSRLTDLDL